MSFYDVMVAAVPTANRDAYEAHARRTWKDLFEPMGALSVAECWGEDVPAGETTSFPMAVKAGEDETVVVSWIEWPDRATRDAAMERMMAMGPEAMGDMPFDGRRMIYGGFAPLMRERA